MNAIGMLSAHDALRLANERMQELHREAANERLHSMIRRPGMFGRIAAAVSSMRASLTTIDADFTTLPSLSEYPYRG
jgi:hypothetical protein